LRARALLEAGLFSASGWVACETLGGLFFLALGVRLWRYRIAPLFLGVTSPVVWTLAFLLLGPLTLAWLAFEDRLALSRTRRLAARAAFFMTAGPALEVVLNRGLFAGLAGHPLYAYTLLPTFGGSGSLLSPLYYATLLVHVPWVERARSAALATAPALSGSSPTPRT
jgi:hypothetical protein